jgi:transposase
MDGAYLRFRRAARNRKGIDSLARLCQERLEADPFSGCLFVFRSRRGTAVRILTYDLCLVFSNVQSFAQAEELC